MQSPILNLAKIKLLSAVMGLTSPKEPFPWQKDCLAAFLENKIPSALDIPTGLGKTSVMAIWLVAWLSGVSVPRRLVYVVDRRAVVDQATSEAMSLRSFVEARPDLAKKLGTAGTLPISTLRGKHVDNRVWLENPASPAIIVGTVDMIGSRLLFEGYGVSRKMRPYHAGLLGADTLIVLDEAHLVPPFEKLLERLSEQEGELRPKDEANQKLVPGLKLLSLSATGRSDKPALGLTGADLEPGTITHKRLTAPKHLDFKPLGEDEDLADALARHAWDLSNQGKSPVKIIVFSNKRDDAEKAKIAIEKRAKGDKKADLEAVHIDTQLIVGGRRVHERQATAKWLADHKFVASANGRPERATFVFATSAGEVGIDLDADHMVGDLVAWERMIQRFGRVNRRGEGNANIIIVQQPDPKPTKAEENALKKPVSERDKKEQKAAACREEKLAKARALVRPFDLLPRDEKGINVCPAALRDLKLSTLPNPEDEADDRSRAEKRAILANATTEAPLRPALSRPLVDAWSMTSLPQHTGRPKVQPWLRGWVEDAPQTTVVWRCHMPFDRSGKSTPDKIIEGFFDAAPPHASEGLETETSRVIAWLKKRAEAIQKSRSGKVKATPGSSRPALRLDEWFAILLGDDGEPDGAAMTLDSLLSDLSEKKSKDRLEGRLAGATLVLDARFAGLSKDGLLSDTEDIPQTLDDGTEWLETIKGEPAIRFRIRERTAEQAESTSETDNGWSQRLRVPIETSVEGEVLRWLIVEKWRSDSTTPDDGGSGKWQTLTDHQNTAIEKAGAIAGQIGLPEAFIKMLKIAARLHDEGKRAEKWQKAFKAKAIGGPYAKTPGPINQALLDGYRHEFTSLKHLADDSDFQSLPSDLQDLAQHLVAAHHGFARPLISTQGCSDAPPSLLESRAREVALRFVRLQRRWGPWGLAWWESLLRAADQQASRELELTSDSTSTTSAHG